MFEAFITILFLFFLFVRLVASGSLSYITVGLGEESILCGEFVHRLSLLDLVLPLENQGLGCLNVVLALAVRVLEEVQATWQHKFVSAHAV